MQVETPISIHDLRPVCNLFWPVFDLGVNLDFDLHQTTSVSRDAAEWEDYNVDDAWILALLPILADLWAKSQIPTIVSLTWPQRSPVDLISLIWMVVTERCVS